MRNIWLRLEPSVLIKKVDIDMLHDSIKSLAHLTFSINSSTNFESATFLSLPFFVLAGDLDGD